MPPKKKRTRQQQRPVRIDGLLKQIYENISHPYSFSSPYQLYAAAKKLNKKITLQQVEDWLTGQRAYTLHRAIKTRFPRRKVLVPGVGHQYQADLVDYEPIKKENKNFRYLLTIIDCFSRFALALPLKTKKGEEVAIALENAFKKMGAPKKFQTDKGSEFYNSNVKKVLDKLNIEHFSTDQDVKAQIVERFNRTLREKLQKYMVAKNTLNYINILPDFLDGYNSKIHGSLKEYAPKNVNSKNEEKVHDAQYGEYLAEKKRAHVFEIGDPVRISVFRGPFKKTYHKNFTEEIFHIADKLYTKPPTFRIIDKKGEIFPGGVYHSELQKVKEDN